MPANHQASLERLYAALAAQGLDPGDTLRQIPALATATLQGSTDEQPEIGQQLVALKRRLQPNAPGSPAADTGWDRFFGAMQVNELRANAQGRNMDFDPSGFGMARAQDLGTGRVYDLEHGQTPPGYLPTRERNAYYADRPQEAIQGAQAVRRFREAQSRRI